jgi:RNA-directed DNA polymerase
MDQRQNGEDGLAKVLFSSINKLEFMLRMDRDELRALAQIAGSLHRPFYTFKKPRPFQRITLAPKPRKIDNPLDKLKAVQRRINETFLKPFAFPEYIKGGVKGRSVLSNVEMHRGARLLVKLDIRAFFPTVTTHQVYSVWRTQLNFSSTISELLTRLTTFERHLPQGAPTSTLLANLVLLSVDGPIREKCESNGVTYSSWIDDLAFSGDNAREVIQTAVVALRAAGFAVSHKKLEIQGPEDRKTLNGILVGRFLSLPSERLACIRSGIHKFATGRVSSSERAKYLRSLEGKIAHVSSVVPHKGRKLAATLENAKMRVASECRTEIQGQ